MIRYVTLVALMACFAGDARAAVEAESTKSLPTVVYKHNQWPLTVLEFREGKEGPASAFVYRYNFVRRLGDAYAVHSPDGTVLAQGSFWHEGVFSNTFCGARMRVTGPKDEVLANIAGTCATMHRALFNIEDANGQPIATAFVAYSGNDIVIVDAATQRQMLATMTYTAEAVGLTAAHWTLWHLDEQALPPAVARAFVSYIVDHQTVVAPYSFVAGVSQGAKTFHEAVSFWWSWIPGLGG